MKPVLTDQAPLPNGHYVQALVHGDLVFLSMQLPINPKNPTERAESIEQQTEQLIENVSNVLLASGSSLSQTLRVTLYLTDINLWDAVNKIFTAHFGNHKPARGVVAVTGLHLGYKIAMDAVGVVTRGG